MKRLYLMSKKESVGMFRIEMGNVPERKLLLRSNSYRYFSDASFDEMVPEKLLELAWKRAKSGS